MKNAAEIEGFHACHISDGAALVRRCASLEEQLNRGMRLFESQGADQLGGVTCEYRRPLAAGIETLTLGDRTQSFLYPRPVIHDYLVHRS